MNRSARHSISVLLAMLLALGLGFAVSRSTAEAQTTVPQITSVTVTNVEPTSASIAVTVTPAAPVRIAYGTSASYGTNVPDNFGQASTTFLIKLDPLDPSTTYHFRAEAKYDAGTVKSADRTFTTGSATSTTTPLVLSTRGYECLNDRCQVNFSTNRPASTQLAWDTAAKPSFEDYANVLPATTGTNILVTGLTDNTEYHYRLRATAGSSVATTPDLTFKTSSGANDRTFSTGFCTVPNSNPPIKFPIGGCAEGYYCESLGIARQSCTSTCGYTCPSGSTCRSDGNCEPDPLLSGSPYQCNRQTCYGSNDELLNPLPAGCYTTWPKCNANTILKVRKDRDCNVWLTCATSYQTQASASGPGENLCLSLAACNSLNQNGQCNRYLPPGQCNNDPLRFCSSDTDCEAGGSCNIPVPDSPTRSLQEVTYATPKDITKIVNLSGNVVAGLNWTEQGGANIIQGMLPWQLMRQIGSRIDVDNGDFENQLADPTLTTPWMSVPLNSPKDAALEIKFEDQNVSFNHVLDVEPQSSYIPTKGTCSNDASKSCVATDLSKCPSSPEPTCLFPTLPIKFSGVASGAFTTFASEYYFAQLRVRATKEPTTVRVQFGFSDYTEFTVGSGSNKTPAYVDVQLTSAWQRVTLGPIIGLSGPTRLAVVCADSADCQPFQIDDVQVSPVLQVTTNPRFIAPSCRLYPKDNAPSCDYRDENGVIYRGWHGYCLETDSVTGTCLSWWPVDLIRGESNIFGSEQTAGYQDRAPLFYCAEAAGRYNAAIIGEPYLEQYRTTNGNRFDPHPFYGHELGYLRYLETAIDSISGSDTTGCGDDVEDRASCRDGTQAGICICTGGVKTLTACEAGNGCDFTLNSKDAAVHRYDVEYFRTAVQRYDSSFGVPDLILSDKTACPDDGNAWCGQKILDNGNGTTIRLNWNPSDQHLEKITVTVDGRNEADPATGYFAAGLFLMKEQCTKVVEVVRPDGSNMAYGDRINSKTYSVPDLQYGRDQDLAPFGGAQQPASSTGVDSTDPTTWTTPLNAESEVTSEFTGGQARAGTPYACQGNCAKQICSADPVGNNCATPDQIRQCKNKNLSREAGDTTVDADDLAVIGRCIGVAHPTASASAPSVASDRGVQVLDPTHDPTQADASNPSDNPYFAEERLRRLFTESYGVFEWTALSAAPICSLSTPQACSATKRVWGCSSNLNGHTVGYPSAQFIGYPAPSAYHLRTCPNSGKSTDAAYADAAFFCTHVHQYQDGDPVYNNIACRGDNLSCADGTTGTNAYYHDDQYVRAECGAVDSYSVGCWVTCTTTDTWQFPNTSSGTSAAGSYQKISGGWDSVVDICPLAQTTARCNEESVQCAAGGSKTVTGQGQSTVLEGPDKAVDNAIADAKTKCQSELACDGTDPSCPSSGTQVKYDDVTVNRPDCTTYSDLSANYATCPATCKLTTATTYRQATVISPSELKPKRPDFPNDFCAVPAQVSNAQFTNASGKTIIVTGGSGNVGIKFNTSADKEQQPLQKLTIDWGDVQEGFPFPFAPRSDPSKPHIFAHPYVISGTTTGACQTDATGRTVCTYPIKIQVRDNWGWCNDAVGTKKCQDDRRSNGTFDSSQWYDTGLRVKVISGS